MLVENVATNDENSQEHWKQEELVEENNIEIMMGKISIA
jgi:hypothetical protein